MHQAFLDKSKSLCKVHSYHLDPLQLDTSSLEGQAKEIADLILLEKPNLIIAADDVANKMVIAPYLQNSKIPTIHIGINWDPRPYGYPNDYSTGMVEVWPTEKIYSIIRKSISGLNKLTLIASETSWLDNAEISRLAQDALILGINVKIQWVSNQAQWKQAVLAAQKDSDAIYLGSNHGIKDWQETEVVAWLKQHNKKFTFTAYEHMMPYSLFGLLKSPQEFAHWAAKAIYSILVEKTLPWQIPIVPNQQFLPVINQQFFLEEILLPDVIKRNAINYTPDIFNSESAAYDE